MAETKILSDLNARVWKIEVAVGDSVAEGDVLMILESMKTEIPVEATRAGVVKAILVKEEEPVTEDQALVILE
ncbi:MAG: biotin/lipoyl-binding protein [Acetobacteraceae bacterium]|nr:biotin/lipoyl-binding protein [Acetobacteraceae bacterium]